MYFSSFCSVIVHILVSAYFRLSCNILSFLLGCVACAHRLESRVKQFPEQSEGNCVVMVTSRDPSMVNRQKSLSLSRGFKVPLKKKKFLYKITPPTWSWGWRQEGGGVKKSGGGRRMYTLIFNSDRAQPATGRLHIVIYI